MNEIFDLEKEYEEEIYISPCEWCIKQETCEKWAAIRAQNRKITGIKIDQICISCQFYEGMPDEEEVENESPGSM